MNQLITTLALAVLLLAGLAVTYSLILRSRLPHPGPRTWTLIGISFLLVITPKR